MSGFTTETLELPGWDHLYSGKVRDLYTPAGISSEEADRVLVVASDRISAYDFVLDTPIPDKGKVLTQLSLWWFDQLKGFANHVISTEVPEAVAGRAMVCRKLQMYPIECIARGYLTGSGLAEYRGNRTVCSLPLPEGLVDGSALEPAIFTPSAKAEVGEHDENITFEEVVERVGTEVADVLRVAGRGPELHLAQVVAHQLHLPRRVRVALHADHDAGRVPGGSPPRACLVDVPDAVHAEVCVEDEGVAAWLGAVPVEVLAPCPDPFDAPSRQARRRQLRYAKVRGGNQPACQIGHPLGEAVHRVALRHGAPR